MAAIPERAPDQGGSIEADPDVSDHDFAPHHWHSTDRNSSTMGQTRVLETTCRCQTKPLSIIRDSRANSASHRSKYTASLTSSIERYPVENGRRYHAFKDGNYVMPNDESELDRLDLTHQMLRITLGNKIYLSPIGDKPWSILDIGTGTGIWAIEMGDEFPDTQIIGTDLSPTQPSWCAVIKLVISGRH